ncbi:MAG: hypothetical protein D6695_04635 [Planctomycetota bacterium]|nr:MAG: hypothetical protein D6695_04635 [Planctomycetota bacterium]
MLFLESRGGYDQSMMKHGVLAGLAAILTVVPAWRCQAEDLVQPETLEQGFVIVVDDVARFASKDRPMYLASNLGGWDPAHPDFKMTARSDGRWQIVFEGPVPNATLQFKFTLGSWDYVETDPDGNDIDNRTLPKVDRDALGGRQPVFELRVPRFRSPDDILNQRDSTEYRDWTVTGTLKRLQVAGGAGPASGAMRDLLVWLPPAYFEPENASRTFPVLYLFDGQNLFESRKGGPEEWRVDEIMSDLIESGRIEPVIVVGVPHGGTARMAEYQPFDMGLQVEPAGREFGRWFMTEVKPRVERAFRVTGDRTQTGIGGASLGATISLFMAAEYPQSFGLLLLESTAGAGRGGIAWAETVLASMRPLPERVFVGVGGREFGDEPGSAERNKRFEQYSRWLVEQMKLHGLDSEKIRLVVDPDARHHEPAWSKRFPEAMTFLFGCQSE